MIEQILNIIFELKNAFTPKKKSRDHLHVWQAAPMDYNCRCTAEPIVWKDEGVTLVIGDGRVFRVPLEPSFEERRNRFNEECHATDALDYSKMPYIHPSDSKMSMHEQIALSKFIDGIYKKKWKEDFKPKLTCIVCFNGECSCRI